MRTKPKQMPRGKPFTKGYDERRNLTGAPSRGESHAEVYNKTMNMTPQDVVLFVGNNNDLGKMFIKMPKDIPLKTLLALRNIAAEMFEPSAGRMVMMMERVEGRVSDRLDLSNTDGTLSNQEAVYERVLERLEKHMEDSKSKRTKTDTG